MAYGTVSADIIQSSVTGVSLGAGNATNFKNRIINGGMTIDQRNAGASVTITANPQYTLDRWYITDTVASKLSVQQNAGSVTPPVGFKNYLGATSLSAYTVGATELFLLRQGIEGNNVADFGWGTASAKTVTLSAWVYSSLTGTFSGTLRNAAANRFYVFSYSISSANTWTQISVTIPGDTSGTWATDNTVGIDVMFSLGTGSTYQGTAGSWGSTAYYGATGTTSVVGTNGATFYITGVQLEVGSMATGFDFRDYGRELMLCQRYLPAFVVSSATFAGFGSGMNYATSAALIYLPFFTTPRTAPTGVTVSAASDFCCWLASTATTACTGLIFNAASLNGVVMNPTGMSGLASGDATILLSNNAANAKILCTGCEL
jgi:hypothetical protein